MQSFFITHELFIKTKYLPKLDHDQQSNFYEKIMKFFKQNKVNMKIVFEWEKTLNFVQLPLHFL